MYIVNTYRWDYDTVAALVAPKPMLVENTNADPIFPEDGVRRIWSQLQKVYAWYNAQDNLGLTIGQGGHVDTPEIRHPSFAFFDRFLKNKPDSRIEEPDRKVPIEDLKVLKPGEIPAGNRNDKIYESFIDKADPPPVPTSSQGWKDLQTQYMNDVKAKVFAGWPSDEDSGPLAVEVIEDKVRYNLHVRLLAFNAQPGVRIQMAAITLPGDAPVSTLHVTVLNDAAWKEWSTWLPKLLQPDFDPDKDAKYLELKAKLSDHKQAFALIPPRGIGPTAWPSNVDTKVRRRFYLLGQSLDGMRVWDVRRALKALSSRPEFQSSKIELSGANDSAAIALWAAAFEPAVSSITLENLPTSVEPTPAFLNLSRIMDMPQALALLYPKSVTLKNTTPDSWKWTTDLARALGTKDPWPTFQTRP
jgi:hypothetical protein